LFGCLFISRRTFEKVADGEISGRIASSMTLIGYGMGQFYSLPESQLIDWMIAKPDGTEEGNEVGKFLDTYHP